MPGISPLLDVIDAEQLASHPENVKLWLPSSLPLTSRDETCIPDLPRTEYRIRRIQAFQALNDLRRAQRIYHGLLIKNKAHITTSQKTKTRSQGLFGRFKAKVHRATMTYRAAHTAIRCLAPDEKFGPWKNALRQLRNEDVRGPGYEGDKPSGSRHVPSWIWFTSPGQRLAVADLEVPATPSELHDSIRVEWCRLQERLRRFQEEVELTVEEMRRVLVFFEWKACQWEASAVSRNDQDSVDKQTKIGICAYAHRQASVCRRMITVFLHDWFALLESNDLGSSWTSKYPRPPPIDRHRLVSNVNLYHPNALPVEPDFLVEDSMLGVGEAALDGYTNTDSCNDTDANPGRDVDADSDSDYHAT